jgi:hypothetical protein
MRASLFGWRVCLAVLAAGLMLAGTPPDDGRAQPASRVEVSPASAAPGETVTVRGTGWPADASLGMRLYEAADVGGAGSALGGEVVPGPDGAFSSTVTIPRTLFGQGSRGNLNVVPGPYTLVVTQDTRSSVSASVMVGAPAQAGLLWGESGIDLDGNGVRDARDQPAQAVVTVKGVSAHTPPTQAISDARGRFVVSPIPPGTYHLEVRADLQSQPWTTTADVTVVLGQVARADLLLRAEGESRVPASLVAAQGTTLYVGADDRLVTLDLADPTRPAFLAQSPSLGAPLRSLTVSGTLAAVVLTGGGLQLLDVADPRHPLVLGSYATPNTTAGVAFLGQLLLVPVADALNILDLSTPGQPRPVGSYRPMSDVRGVTAAGRYAYVVSGDNTLRLVDVADPTRPVEVGAVRVEGAGYLSPVAVAHGNAFGTFIFGHYASSVVIDVADSTRPVRRTDVSSSLYTTADAFAVQGDRLSTADAGLIGFGSVRIVDIADHSSPALVGSLEAQWDPLAIAVQGRWAYVLGRDHLLHVLDVTNPTAVHGVALASSSPLPVPPDIPHDDRYFAETGYRIEDDAVWDYFGRRGALDTFGYPVSRAFTFLGCPVQVFQREIAQHCPGRGVQLLNVLDPDLFPYTRVNSSTFPAADEHLKTTTPAVNQPDYPTAILDFVAANAPDTWNGQPVRFGSTFRSLITPEMAGTDDPAILGLLNLEVWGAPISEPVADPSNPNFIYQRFQRGIMHFDATTGVTRGILLADYLKGLLRDADLPPDLRAQAATSPLFSQYCPGAPNWLCRPDGLSATDLTFAFAAD